MIAENVSDSTGLGLGVHTTINPKVGGSPFVPAPLRLCLNRRAWRVPPPCRVCVLMRRA